MSLPENPTGRDLAAFADELQAAGTVANRLAGSLSQLLMQASIAANNLANERFAKEARQAIADEAEPAAEQAEPVFHYTVSGPFEGQLQSNATPPESLWPVTLPPGTKHVFVRSARRPVVIPGEDGYVIIPAK